MNLCARYVWWAIEDCKCPRGPRSIAARRAKVAMRRELNLLIDLLGVVRSAPCSRDTSRVRRVG